MAYVIKSGRSDVVLDYLPYHDGHLKNGESVVIDSYREEDVPQMYQIFNEILEEGATYPQLSVENEADFRTYYLSHDGFVVRDATTGEVIGGFYVKPNYPGRSSHICNAGFIVKNTYRNKGIGRFMVPWFLRIAHDLGYEASVFNLVYVTNEASVKLWENYGFSVIGRVPRAGNLKGLGYVDACVYHYDLTTVPEGLPPFTLN